MADVYGYNLEPLDTAVGKLLYTCPVVSAAIDVAGPDGAAEDVVTYAQQAVTQTQITSIWLTTVGAAGRFRIFVTPTDATDPMTLDSPDGDAYCINYRGFLDTLSTQIVQPGIVLGPGETVWVQTGTPDKLVATIFYIEVS
jgi:hypothetical protein